MNLELLLAALLTLAVETAFLALTCRRDAAFLALCAARERRHEPHAEPHPSPSARRRGRLGCLPAGGRRRRRRIRRLRLRLWPLEEALLAHARR